MKKERVKLKPDKYVYMTTLTNADYIPGVKALSRSLQKVQSEFNLIILIPENKQEELIPLLEKDHVIDSFCSVKIAPPIINSISQKSINQSHYWDNTFFKLLVTGCTEFSKIVLLDSDMLILKNIDHLFSCPNFSAAVAGQSLNPQYKKLNSGLMVIAPSESLHQQAVKAIEPVVAQAKKNGEFCGDQDVFQAIYPDWENKKELFLPEVYNTFWGQCRNVRKNYNIMYDDFYVIHFAGAQKPWMSLLKYCFCRIKILIIMLFFVDFKQLKFLFIYYKMCK